MSTEPPPLKDFSHGYQLVISHHYLCYKGYSIEEISVKDDTRLETKEKEPREQRDGLTHHITFLSPPDCKLLAIQRNLLMNKKNKTQTLRALLHDVRALETDWCAPVDLGPGRIETDKGSTYFRVLHWPMGQDMRQSLGLSPIHFHITTGFYPKDIHAYKGPGALDALQGHSECSVETVDRLARLLPYYKKDTVFIAALFQQAAAQGVLYPLAVTGGYVLQSGVLEGSV
ncbi:hypothetical protein BDF14DRAFT_1772954 [Spinellus fusiger]|nr:hypothetical protein BDF14DRAFT_1772954 [Spinellus fusiger]